MSNFMKSLIAAGIASIIKGWDKLGIKDWANKNIDFRQFGDGVKSLGKSFTVLLAGPLETSLESVEEVSTCLYTTTAYTGHIEPLVIGRLAK